MGKVTYCHIKRGTAGFCKSDKVGPIPNFQISFVIHFKAIENSIETINHTFNLKLQVELSSGFLCIMYMKKKISLLKL